MLRIGSDFSGVGAFEYALNRLGLNYRNVFACDIDKYARQTYLLNHPIPDNYPKDVYDREIPKESLDIYMSSPPCQTFSIAGKRLGKKDKRGILFFNSYEFIKENKPRFFIFENVKGLLSDDEGRTFQEWLNYLGGKSINGLPMLFPEDNAVPYHIYYKVLNAKKLNVPQNRERVFIIGIRDDKDNSFQFPKDEPLTKKLKDVLEKEVDEKYILSKKMLEKITFEFKENSKHTNPIFARCNKVSIGTWRTHKDGHGFRPIQDDNCPTIPARAREDGSGQPVIQINKSKESGGVQPYQQNRVYDINGLNPSLNAGQEVWGGNIINTQKIRRLTPRECFRLMDFPESFKWICSDSQAYKQAGNSIVVKCLEKIINNLIL